MFDMPTSLVDGLYVNTDDMMKYMGIQTTLDTQLVMGFIWAAQTDIERRTKKRFKSIGNETRHYQVNNLMEIDQSNRFIFSWDSMLFNVRQRALLFKEDVFSVTQVLNGDGSIISPDHYWLWPRDKPPYGYLMLKSSAQWVLGINQELSVNGEFCFSRLPPWDIQLAVKELVMYYYRSKDSQVFDVITTPNGVIQVPQGFPANVEQILVNGAYVQLICFA